MESNYNKDNLKSNEEKDEKYFINARLENGLTLRKRKINAILSKKRGFDRFKFEGQKDYNLTRDEINIPFEIKNRKYEDIEQFLNQMKVFIESDNMEYNKFALYCLRIQASNNELESMNKKFYGQIVKKNFISDILIIMAKYFDNKIIIHEGLWILINVLSEQNDNKEYELVLNLSNKQCIELYLKILDKKDSYLRYNTYWLLANLVNNTNFGLTDQILFHLYMSPLFRLYIIKDFEERKNDMGQFEKINLLLILSVLSEFINDTFIRLNKNDIKNFIDYSPNVDYNSIKENNNFLLEHIILIFLQYMEDPELNYYCFIGLAKLTNYLHNPNIFNKFYLSGIARKIINGRIKLDEETVNNAVQIIGNFLNFIPDNLNDPIFIEEILNFYVKMMQTYPSKDSLKRDIFWSASNISINENFCELLMKTGLLVLALQSICTDSDFVINEALYMLTGFFDEKNIKIIFNNYHLDYIKNLVLCLKNLRSKCISGEKYKYTDILERCLHCIYSLFLSGEKIKNQTNGNKFVKDFEKNGGFEILEIFLSENNLSEELTQTAEELLSLQNE